MAEGIGVVNAGDAGHYFTVAEFRASDDEFASATNYPDADIEDAREWAERRFEQAAHCAWVERAGSYTVIGDGSCFISLPHRDIRAISAVTIDGVALTVTDLAELIVHPHGLIKRAAGWTSDTIIVVTYTYGLTTIPGPVKRAVLMLARKGIVPSNLASNAVTESTDAGFIRLSIAAAGGKTGIPEVDAVAADFGHAGVFVG